MGAAANDRLFLVGTIEQLARAEAYLNEDVPREADDAPMVQHSIAIPASSPAIGQPLRDLRLPEATGASFGFVQRADGTTVAPSAGLVPEAGDRVFVYGPEGSMERVHERLKVKHLAVAPPKPKMGPGLR